MCAEHYSPIVPPDWENLSELKVFRSVEHGHGRQMISHRGSILVRGTSFLGSLLPSSSSSSATTELPIDAPSQMLRFVLHDSEFVTELRQCLGAELDSRRNAQKNGTVHRVQNSKKKKLDEMQLIELVGPNPRRGLTLQLAVHRCPAVH